MRSLCTVLCLTAALAILRDIRGQDVKASDGKSEAAVKPAPEELKQSLRDALDMLNGLSDGSRELMPDFAAFRSRLTKELKGKTLLAISRAQLAVDDKPAARATLESAMSTADDVDEHVEKADLLRLIAIAQSDAGDRPAALATLQQALRTGKVTKKSPFPIPMPGMSDADAEEAKAAILGRIATAQARVGDRDAAQATYREATQAANAIKDQNKKAAALADLAVAQAKAGQADDSSRAWSQAMKFALSIDEGLQKARAVERVLRKRVDSGDADAAVVTIANDLSGDLKSYALWVVADQLVSAKAAPTPKLVAELLRIAQTADYDRFSKRAKVFIRIADAQARAGDGEGAVHSVESVDDGHFNHYRILEAKIGLLRVMASARVKSGDRETAQRLLREVRELGAPFHDEDGLSNLSWHEIATEQARAGDFDGARKTAEAIGNLINKVEAYAGIATVEAEAGKKADAIRTLQVASSILPDVPNEVLWTTTAPFLRNGPGGMDFNPTPRARRVLVVARAKAGDLPGALKSATELANDDTIAISRFERFPAFKGIANVQLDAKDWTGAFKTIDSMPDPDSMWADERAQFLAELARKQTKAGDPKGVIVRTRSLKSPAAKASSLKGMAEAISGRDDEGQPVADSATGGGKD